eukprot:4664836-Amphidinium_carterae.1
MLKKRETVLMQADPTFKLDMTFLASLSSTIGVALLSKQFQSILDRHTLSSLPDAVPEFSRKLEENLC